MPPDLAPGAHVLRLSYDTIAFLGPAQNAVAEDPRFWQRGDVRELGLVSYRSSGSRDLPFLVHGSGSLAVEGENPLAKLFVNYAGPPDAPPQDPWRRLSIVAGFVGIGGVAALSLIVAVSLANRVRRGAAVLSVPSCPRCRSLLGPQVTRDHDGRCPECGDPLAHRVAWMNWSRSIRSLAVAALLLAVSLGAGFLLVSEILASLERRVQHTHDLATGEPATFAEMLELVRDASAPEATPASLTPLIDAIDRRNALIAVEDQDLRTLGEALNALTNLRADDPNGEWSSPRLADSLLSSTTRENLGWSDTDWTRFVEVFDRPRVAFAPRVRSGSPVRMRVIDRDVSYDLVDTIPATTTWEISRANGGVGIAPTRSGPFEVSVRLASGLAQPGDPPPPVFTVRGTVESTPPGESLIRPYSEGSIADVMPPPRVVLREVGARWLARLELSDVVAEKPWLHVAGTWTFEGEGQRWEFPDATSWSFEGDASYHDVLVGPFPNGPPRRGVVRFVPDPSTLHLDDDEPADWWSREETFDVEPRIIRLGQ